MKKTLPIPPRLLKSLSEKDREAYKEYYHSSSCKAILNLIIEDSKNRINESVKKSDSSQRFEMSSWPYYQAYESGYRKAYREIIDLLDR